jgi:hypothetical protein
MGALDGPRVDDAPVEQSEEGDFVDVLEATPGGWVILPGADMGAGAGEPAYDLVLLDHEGHHAHVRVRERGAERGDPLPGGGGEERRIDLVGDVQVALVDHLINPAANDILIRLRHPAPPVDRHAPRLAMRPTLIAIIVPWR